MARGSMGEGSVTGVQGVRWGCVASAQKVDKKLRIARLLMSICAIIAPRVSKNK
jgi:hypothetical protein